MPPALSSFVHYPFVRLNLLTAIATPLVVMIDGWLSNKDVKYRAQAMMMMMRTPV